MKDYFTNLKNRPEAEWPSLPPSKPVPNRFGMTEWPIPPGTESQCHPGKRGKTASKTGLSASRSGDRERDNDTLSPVLGAIASVNLSE
jgi:hypothetical protein